MKKIFLVVLIANVIIFAYIRSGGLSWVKPEKHELSLLNEDKIHLLDMSKNVADHSLTVPVQTQSVPDLSSESLHTMREAAQTISGREQAICIEWGDFSGLDLERASAAISTLQLGGKVSHREAEQDTGYWVYMPPLKNKKMVSKKIGELKELGVNEYFVVSTGKWKNAISLGVFKTQEAAQNLLTQLRTKGVRSAKVGERASKLKTTWFVLSNIDLKSRASLIEIQKDFDGSKLENITCTLTR